LNLLVKHLLEGAELKEEDEAADEHKEVHAQLRAVDDKIRYEDTPTRVIVYVDCRLALVRPGGILTCFEVNKLAGGMVAAVESLTIKELEYRLK